MFQRTVCQLFSGNFQREQNESISRAKDSSSGRQNPEKSIYSSEQNRNFCESVIRVRFVLNLFQTLRNGWAILAFRRFDRCTCQDFSFDWFENPCKGSCVWALVFRLPALYKRKQLLMIAEQSLCQTSQ